jgi:hypothetical protein
MNSKKDKIISNSIYECSIVHLPKIHNEAGNLTALENGRNIPFDVKRVYYLYDVPGGAERGGHGHKHLQQFMISLSGSFDVLLDDGRNKKLVHLDRPYIGLHIVPGIWRELINFSSGAICLVLASEIYDEADYLRDYEDYKNFSLH